MKIINYGQSSVERGFFINENIIVENLDDIVLLHGDIYTMLFNTQVKLLNVPITKKNNIKCSKI